MALACNRGARAEPCRRRDNELQNDERRRFGPVGADQGQQVERLPDNLNDEQLKHGAWKQCEDGL
jgi:hypothetical protein